MMEQLKRILDKFLEVLVMVAVAVLVIDVLWQVFTRFVMGDPSSWTEETRDLLVDLGGLAWCRGGPGPWSPTWASITSPVSCLRHVVSEQNYLSFAVVTLFSLLVMVIGGMSLVKQTLALEQISVALHIPHGLCIPGHSH